MRCLLSLVPRCARLRCSGVLAVVLAAGITGVAPGVAGAQSKCPDTDVSYLGACGPRFAVPTWTDAGGWTDPSQYSTIQLADFNGDGRDELLARNDQGLTIWWFDTSLGQWRPQVDGNATPQSLNDFRSPRPGERLATDWTKPEYYSTIQTAHINGNKQAQILARFADGMRVYYFQPGPNGSINGGKWSLISSGGPFSDAAGWNDPSLYLTILTAELVHGVTDLVGRSRTGLVTYGWNGSGWSPRPVPSSAAAQRFRDANCGLPSCFGLFRAATSGGGAQALFGRPTGGPAVMEQYDTSGGGGWREPLIAGFQPFGDTPGGMDCPFPGTLDCLGTSPSYYETFGTDDLNGDGVDELFARASDGLRVRSYDRDSPTTYDDQGGLIAFGGNWTRATGVPGAINGTLTSSGQGAGLAIFDFNERVAVIRLIGPVGPGLGRFGVLIGSSRQPVFVDQSAPRRREQQVLFEASVENVQDARLTLAGFSGTAVIDAIRTYDSADRGWSSLATLNGLAAPALAWGSTPGRWASIRTGDIDGNGVDEVLALNGNALQAWSYGANAWRQLPASPSLKLTGDWLTKPEYYATIRVGDVDGDGRDDVVARGPFGIRTWFYDRRGSGGWERYLPEGYADFPGTATLPAQNTGQAAAYDKLNDLAKGDSHTPTLREVWAGEPTPDTTLLQKLQQDLPGPLLGNCSNQTVLEPPTYASCTPPPPPAGASNRFTADDWKAVVNEMLAESQAAIEVADFFTGTTNSLTSMRQSLFIAEGAELPAMGDKLRLQAAANTSVTYDFQSLFAGTVGIAASIAGVAEPEFSAALWVASELASTIPAPSATANSSFQTTYADLEDQFAAMITEIDKSIADQSQEVRQDEGLMELVGELRTRGTWNMDTIGIGSAANQGFAAWVYSTLMPTIYERYSITNCRDQFAGDGTDCIAPTGLGVVGDNQNFAVIGQRHQLDVFRNEQVPCLTQINDTGDGPDKFITCTWTKPPDDLLNRIWAPVDPSCSYVPGQSSTVWTFSCSAGVDPVKSIGDNSWGFPSYAGNPDPYNAPGGFSSSASAAQADPRVPIVLGRPRQGHRRAVRGRAQVRANAILPRGMRLAGATIKLDRLLFDRRGRSELARPHGRRAPRSLKLTLRRAAPGRFTAATTGRRSVRATVRRTGRRGRARLTLNVGAATFRAPRVCHALPASVAIDTPPLYLETRLAISDGRSRHRLRLEHHVRCVRDRRGNVHRLVRVREPSYPARRGLTVSLHGPRRVQPGTVVSYVARLRNQRRGKDRLASSLWDVTLTRATRTTRIRELRRGRTRSVTFTRRVPRTTTRSRFCVSVVATAAGARAADARSCAAVAAAPPASRCAAEPARHRRAAAACAARAIR